MAQWVWQNPLPTGDHLNGVYCINENIAFAAGAGEVLKTTDGGQTWASQIIGSYYQLSDIYFTDGNTGTVVGNSGKIYRTTNGGIEWFSQLSGVTGYLEKVYFSDSNNGIIVGSGGVILKTTNGGLNWIIRPSGTTSWLQGLSFFDQNNGIAVGSGGTILRTTDGGFTWYTQVSGTTDWLNGVAFADANNAIAIGSWFILKTTNGGATWVWYPGLMSYPYGINFLNNNLGFMFGSELILKTIDGGNSWTSYVPDVTHALYDISFSDAYNGIITGGFGAVLTTSDAGVTWISRSGGITSDLEAVSFSDALHGTAVGMYGIILRTTDGGANWLPQISNTTVTLYAVCFTDPFNGTAVGSGGTILRTTNGGGYWIEQSSGTSATFYGVSFTDANTGTAVGTSGTIRRTTDGGSTWFMQTSGTGDWLGGVSFTDANNGTAVGNAGRILRTTNGGANWAIQTSTVTNDLNGVSFADLNHGFAVADNGWVIKTTNGGTVWNVLPRATTGDLDAVSFCDENIGAAVGSGGWIIKTTNGGLTWDNQNSQSSLTNSQLLGVCFSDPEHGKIVGRYGTILSTTSNYPVISYNILQGTSLSSNRILSNVIISDDNGINVIAGTAPRIYFKRKSDDNTFIDNTIATNGWKFTETVSTSSPFNFLINYTLLYNGTGASPGDSIQYFVVAQDMLGFISINTGVFTASPASVNLTASSFPISGYINYYKIISEISGIVTVGSGGTYSDLTGDDGLFEDINNKALTGDITARIISDIAEPGIYTLDQWAEDGIGNYFLKIEPDAAVLRTLSSSCEGGLIYLAGADRVIIDGRFSGSGSYLKIENTSTLDNTSAIMIMSAGSGSSDNIIRNCIIKAGINTGNTYGIYIGGRDNNNNLLSDNIISRCKYGIAAYEPGSGNMNSLVINGNKIGSDIPGEYVSGYGMYLSNLSAPVISSNEIYNLISNVNKFGLYFGPNISDAVISKNKIHSFDQTNTSLLYTIGIHFSSPVGCSNNRMDNNVICNLNNYGTTVQNYYAGIRIDGGTGYKIYNNSVCITGAYVNPSAGLYSHSFSISSPSTDIDLRNNIFSNTRTGVSARSLSISTVIGTNFSIINNNDYFSSTILGIYNGTVITNLAGWRNLSGQDQYSCSINPGFSGITDLHVSTGFAPSLLESGGAFIPGITTDIDNDTRPGPAGSINGGAIAPDIGADEFDGFPSSSFFQWSLTVGAGWNMVSIPGINPLGQGISKWFAFRDPSTSIFKFDNVYQAVNELEPGKGYWMKHEDFRVYNCGDEWPIGGFFRIPHAPITANNGWNFFGGYEQTVPVSEVTTTPAGLISGLIFTYASGYYPASVISPGNGYWVRLNGAGVINIPSGSFDGQPSVAKLSVEGFGKITISDCTKKNYTLYTVKEGADLEYYSLPPLPPLGIFDIRYSSHRFAEKLSSTPQAIILSSVQNPVKIKAEDVNIILSNESGKEIARLKSGEEITLNIEVDKLFVSENIVPAVYSLEQNYPNPFNPLTTIQFSLPENVQNVKLIIYTTLGEKVAELINTSLDAGIYKYTWEGGNVASGVYIYQIITEKFTSTKKMMLLR